MFKHIKYFHVTVLLFLIPGLFAQNETKKWYFGNQAGLDFMTSPPTPLTNGAMNAWEGCSSIADVSGNLLFYTDGVTVWNRLHVVMANGTGLLGDPSASQTGLIVKQPGNTNIYFIFSLDYTAQPNGLRYSTVDMNLAAGMGSVTVKNTLLYTPTTEKIAATRHCNGVDIWVVSHEYPGNTFRTYLVTSAGVNNVPVISSTGTNYTTTTHTQGCMKISPTGKKIGKGMWYLNGNLTAPVELFDFDNSTGQVSNPLIIKNAMQAYGCEFSADGSKFYCSSTPGTTQMSQWDLCAGSNNAIIASEYTFPTSGMAMQLGPDGKIYVSVPGSTFPHVINNPNVGGPGCNYVAGGPNFGPRTCRLGMPVIVYPKLPLQPFTYTIIPAISCLTASFTAPPPPTITVTACTAVGYSLTNLIWSFGDPLSGPSNTSTISNPIHNYSGPGTYTAQLIYYYSCGGGTDTLRQQITIGALNVNSPQGFSMCPGQTLTLSATGNLTYTWSTGQNTPSITVSPTVNTSYTVYATDANGCTNMAIKTITVNPLPTITITGSNNVCAGAAITQTANGASTYTWNTGANTSTVSLTPSVNTTYSVSGTDINGCVNTATVAVSVVPLPTLTINGSNTVCAGSVLTQTAGGANTYTWSTGVNTNTVSLTPTVNTTYTLYGSNLAGCSSQQTIAILVSQLPLITTIGSNSVCLGSALTLTAGGGNTYTWSTGVNTNTVSVTPSVSTIYTLTGTNTNGCVNSGTVAVSVMPLPAVSITGNSIVCLGSFITQSANGANSYTWSTGENATVINPAPVVNTTYTVTGSDLNGCINTATVLIIVSPNTAVTGFSYSPVCQNNASVVPALANGFSSGGSFSAGGLIIDAGTGQVNVSPAGTGTFLVTYSVITSGCQANNTASLIILPANILTTNPPVTIYPGTSTTLNVSGGTNYTWSPVAYLSCTDCATPVASPIENTQYCVISDLGTCISKACVDIIVSCEGNTDFSVPNAFTPNGDNNNDAFCLQGWNNCVKDFNVKVFDRWGEKVYESYAPDFCWDGMYKGQLLSADVYVYIIKATVNSSSKGISKKGNITLIR